MKLFPYDQSKRGSLLRRKDSMRNGRGSCSNGSAMTVKNIMWREWALRMCALWPIAVECGSTEWYRWADSVQVLENTGFKITAITAQTVPSPHPPDVAMLAECALHPMVGRGSNQEAHKRQVLLIYPVSKRTYIYLICANYIVGASPHWPVSAAQAQKGNRIRHAELPPIPPLPGPDLLTLIIAPPTFPLHWTAQNLTPATGATSYAALTHATTWCAVTTCLMTHLRQCALTEQALFQHKPAIQFCHLKQFWNIWQKL